MRRETVSKAEGGGKFQMFATPSDAYQDRTGEEITGHLALRTSNFYFLFSASRRPLVMVTFSCLAVDPRRRVVGGRARHAEALAKQVACKESVAPKPFGVRTLDLAAVLFAFLQLDS